MVQIINMPKDLTLKDCLVKKEFVTIEDQRQHFRYRMLDMARQGHDEEDGWAFFGKTDMKGLPVSDQLDVYAREVEWSEAKQYRSVVETGFSCDEVFDYLLAEFANDCTFLILASRAREEEQGDGRARLPLPSPPLPSLLSPSLSLSPLPAFLPQPVTYTTTRIASGTQTAHILSEQFRIALSNIQAAAIMKANLRQSPFILIEDDSVTCILLRTVPFPWPLTPR